MGEGQKGPTSRQEVKVKLGKVSGATSASIVGEDGFIKPDCQEFAQDHPGAERAELASRKFLRVDKNRRKKAEEDDIDEDD